MPSVKLPIRGYPYQNIDDTETSVTPAALIDGYVNENNTYVKRPGLAEFVDLEMLCYHCLVRYPLPTR